MKHKVYPWQKSTPPEELMPLTQTEGPTTTLTQMQSMIDDTLRAKCARVDGECKPGDRKPSEDFIEYFRRMRNVRVLENNEIHYDFYTGGEHAQDATAIHTAIGLLAKGLVKPNWVSEDPPKTQERMPALRYKLKIAQEMGEPPAVLA